MGIQSTRTIPCDMAIDRIRQIHDLAIDMNYREIEAVSSEHDYDVASFVDNYVQNYKHNIDHIEKWTDRMIEDVLDQPFFRFSMFENYHIERD